MLKKTSKKKPAATKGKASPGKPTLKKRTVAKTSTPIVAKVIKLSVPKAPFKQSELFSTLAEQCDLSKKQAKMVFEILSAIAKVHLVKNGPGEFTIPGLLKMRSVVKAATKAKKGRNPFTGEEIMIKAKPASRVLKLKAVKKFKDQVN